MAELPFELVVLEVALGDVCNVLQRLTKELEQQAHPALEALTRDVSWFWTDKLLSTHLHGTRLNQRFIKELEAHPALEALTHDLLLLTSTALFTQCDGACSEKQQHCRRSTFVGCHTARLYNH